MNINAILATDLDYGIGANGDLPWPKNKRDLEWFKKHTANDIVLMGRATWESLYVKPLPNRVNVVASTKKLPHPKDGGPDHVFEGDLNRRDLELLFGELYPEKDTIWIMGGANVYHQSLSFCDKLYLTTFRKNYKCDRYVESDIIVKFPIIEYWEEDDEVTSQIRGNK